MYEKLFKSMAEIEKNNETAVDNYQSFQKLFSKYSEDAKKAGLFRNPTKEELFGIPYKGR